MGEVLKILLIEDNPADARLVDIQLNKAFGNGYTLETCNYLSKGLELIEKNTYTIIIVDLSLPDSTGIEAFVNIFEKSPNCPIIILTGIDDESTGINAVKLGAQDFLIKGKSSSRSLKRSISYSLERYKLIKELSDKSKKLEEKTKALYEEEQKLAEAQKLSHIGSWEWDLVNNSLKWSDELYQIYNLNPEDKNITHQKMLECVHVSDREYVESAIAKSKSTLHPFNFYYRIILPGKIIKPLHSRGIVIADESGNAVKMIGTDQDITERVYEATLEKLVIAATKSYNSVIIADKEGKVEWVNEGFTKLTGYLLEDVKNIPVESLRKGNKMVLSDETDFEASIINKKKPVTYECKNYTKGGTEYWVITTFTPVLDDNGEVERILAIDSDITIRKQMEEELIRANKIAEHSLKKGNKALDELMKAKKELEKSMKVKEQFLANMSHEIRTPMNAIVGFTDLILKTPLTLEQKQYLDAIKISGENLIVIINDILDISKIQSGKITIEQIDFRLSQSMSVITEIMLQKSIEKNITLSVIIDKNIPDRLIGDPTRLNQILLNLVGNAIKFTEKGEVKTHVQLISENGEEVELKFLVSDTGIGIPDDKFCSIFDAFTQATNETTRKFGGSGLGLTIVKQLVEIQGGKVSVQSKVGVGSTFTFNLKLKKNLSQENLKVNITDEEKNTELVRDVKVLLVEDNILNQILAKKVLTDWDWNVEVADNGIIAIDKLKKEDFDLILMDIQLPEMDGYEATIYIRNKFLPPKCNTPIMAMTAHAMSTEEEKCKKIGMNGYISKPFSQKVLYSKIISVLNKIASDSCMPAGIKNEHMEKRIKHIDLKYLEELSNGSNTFMKEMIKIFITSTPEALDNMEKHLKNQNWSLLRGVLHKIKPSISFVGLKEIEESVKNAEQYAANETNLELLPDMISTIKQTCHMGIEELKSELEKIS